MKKWLKENILAIVGNIFIWVLPLVLCLIMSFGGTKEETPISFKISLWGIVVIFIYIIAYHKKLKKLIERHKTLQLAKLGYVKIWVRIVEWVSYLLPYVCALIGVIGLHNCFDKIYNDLITFMVLAMISATIGYVILVIDTKQKSNVE